MPEPFAELLPTCSDTSPIGFQDGKSICNNEDRIQAEISNLKDERGYIDDRIRALEHSLSEK
jgi:hypothetical protein